MTPDKTMHEQESVNRDEVERNLAGFSALNKLSQNDRKTLAGAIVVYEFEPDDRLVEKRGAGDYLYLVQEGHLTETGKDSAGAVWWQRTHDTGAVFFRQASYGGLYEETEVVALTKGVLYAIDPRTLNLVMTADPNLRQRLVSEPIARRLRAMPLLAPLDESQIRRLAIVATVHEFPENQDICAATDEPAAGWFWFIDWGQVEVFYEQEMPPDTPPIITSGNFFYNLRKPLGEVPHVASARAVHRAKLIRLPLSEMQILAKNKAIANRLKPPPILKYLRTVEAFNDLAVAGESLERLNRLASITAWEHYPAPQTVSQQGVRDNALRILHRGAAVVRATDDQGRERPRDFLAPGRAYGNSSLFRQERHEVTVRAVRPDSTGAPGTLLTSTLVTADPAHADEPGATWFRIRYEDLDYLVRSEPGLWQGTHLLSRIQAEKKQYRKYPWQEDDEVLCHDGHRHIIVLITRLLLPAVVLVALGGLDYLLGRWQLDLPALALLLFTIFTVFPLILWIVVDYLNDYFVVTSLRVTAREQVILLYEKRTEAPLDQVQDTTLNVGFWGSLFGYGDLRIKTANAAIQIKFDRVGNPARIQGIISEQMRRLKAERTAEQREGLRMRLVQDLRLSLLSQVAEFTLPPGLKPPPQLTWWQWLLAHLAKTVHLVFLPVEFVLLRPISWVLRTFFPRRLAARKAETKFGGGTLGSWDVAPDRTIWRKHWLILMQRVWQSFVSWLIVTGFGLVIIQGILPISLLAPLVVWLAATAWLWWQYEDWANDLYIVTNEKVIDIERKPFGFSEQRREAGLERIQNVVAEVPTFWANALNYGNVLIKTAAADEGFTFDLVANPRAVQYEIMRRLSVYRASRQQREADAQRAQQAYILGVYHELMEETGKYAKTK